MVSGCVAVAVGRISRHIKYDVAGIGRGGRPVEFKRGAARSAGTGSCSRMFDELYQGFVGTRFWRAAIAYHLSQTIGRLKIPCLTIDEIALQPGGQLEPPTALLRVRNLDHDVLGHAGSIEVAVRQNDFDTAVSSVYGQSTVAGGARAGRRQARRSAGAAVRRCKREEFRKKAGA